jgi:ribosomal protein L40E
MIIDPDKPLKPLPGQQSLFPEATHPADPPPTATATDPVPEATEHEIIICNRCDTQRPATYHPCPRCRCPEFRLTRPLRPSLTDEKPKAKKSK